MTEPARAPTCMGIVDEALRLERIGKPVIHLEKGELDLDTPAVVKERAIQAIQDNRTRYSDSNGLPELRNAICASYERVYGVSVAPSRVIVSSGSSPAMLELFLALLAPGDQVVLPNPGYPAYPSFVEAARGRVVWAGTRAHGFAYTAAVARPLLTPATRAVVINFPSNPVGVSVEPDALREFAELGPLIVSDEVYHGLSFDAERPRTILEFTDNAVVVGSFSKGYAMTGWRLGYLIVPERLVERLIRQHQYLFVGTNTFVQWAALAALEHADSIKDRIRTELRARRDHALASMPGLGFEVTYAPRGGFYLLARQPDVARTSARFAADLLEQVHVATTPGSEFGSDAEGYIRFSLSSPIHLIDEAMARIGAWLHDGVGRPAAAPASCCGSSVSVSAPNERQPEEVRP